MYHQRYFSELAWEITILKRSMLIAAAMMITAILAAWASTSFRQKSLLAPLENVSSQDTLENGDEANTQLGRTRSPATSISKLAELRVEAQQAIGVITRIVESSECNADTQCDSIAIGSKACGGPKSFAVYSKTLPQHIVDTLNVYARKTVELEKQINLITQAMSTCSVNLPPRELVCINMRCVSSNARESLRLIQSGQKAPYTIN